MRFRNQVLIITLCVLFALSALLGNHAVLCFEADGAVRVEMRDAACCPEDNTTAAEPHSVPVTIAEQSDCGPCVDVGIEITALTVPKPQPMRAVAVLVQTPLLPFLSSPKTSRMDTGGSPSVPLSSSLRSTVLLL